MDITKKSFMDGFSWVTNAIKACLPKAPSFIVVSVLATIVFSILVLLISLVGVLFAKIPVIGIIISLAVLLLTAILSLGFYCGYLKAIQTILNDGKVSFGSFFFALKDKQFLIKILPFAIILGLTCALIVGAFGYLSYLAIVSTGSQVLFYICLVVMLVLLVIVMIYGTYSLILFIQRNDHKIMATLKDTANGLLKNITSIIGMYIGLLAISIVTNFIAQALTNLIIGSPNPSIAMAVVVFVVLIIIYCIVGMISVATLCLSAKEIFVENDGQVIQKNSQQL